MTGSSNNVYAKKYLVNYRVISTRDKSGQRVSEQFQLHDVTTENPDMIKNSEIDCKENRSHGGKCSFFSQIETLNHLFKIFLIHKLVIMYVKLCSLKIALFPLYEVKCAFFKRAYSYSKVLLCPCLVLIGLLITTRALR